MERRGFLKLGLAPVAGTAAATGAVVAQPQPTPVAVERMKSAGFGWELTGVNGNGNDIICPVLTSIVIVGIEVDLAFMPYNSPGPGVMVPNPAGGPMPLPPSMVNGYFAEVLANISLSLGTPSFNPDKSAALNLPPDPNFGAPQWQRDPSPIGGMVVPALSGQLAAVILKTWVGAPPFASATHRHVSTSGLRIPAPAGSFLVFHMDHGGYPGDAEMQTVLFYE